MQQTDEWRQMRAGRITATRIYTLAGNGEGRKKLLRRIAAERLTGQPLDPDYQSPAMARGLELEDQARAQYEILTGNEVYLVDFVRHPERDYWGCSPDGMVGDYGLIEIKCPEPDAHIATLMGAPVKAAYRAQIQWQLYCTGRVWCDYVSYQPNMSGDVDLSLIVRRIERNEADIAALVDAAERAEAEIAEIMEEMRHAQT